MRINIFFLLLLVCVMAISLSGASEDPDGPIKKSLPVGFKDGEKVPKFNFDEMDSESNSNEEKPSHG